MRTSIVTLTAALALGAAAAMSGAQAQMRQGTGPGTMRGDGCEAGMGMMCMMGEQPRMGMMGQANMTQRVEQRLAALKTQLKITEAQTKAWDAYAAAVRDAANAMSGQRQAFMGQMRGAALPQRLDFHEAMLVSHLEQLRKTKAAVAALYAVLSDDQKKTADGAMMGPMTRGPMRGPMRRQ